MTLSLPTAEQLALAGGVGDFLADQFALGRFRAGGRPDVERWGEFTALGIIGISLGAAEGGLGLSAVEEMLVCRELGRALVSPALIGAMLAPHVAARSGKAVLCEAILSGARRVGIAVGVADGQARVADADGLFLQVGADRLSLIDAAGGLRELRCIDETVSLTAASLPGSVVAEIRAPELVLAAQVMAAGMLCGTLEASRDLAVDFARTRVQFGRPIGAFQAIKHRCADAALGAEIAYAQSWNAAHAVAAGAADAEFRARAAKWLAGDEALKAARFDIQAHGGMGFTQEVDAQRILKRIHVLHQMFGNPRLVPAQLAALPLEV